MSRVVKLYESPPEIGLGIISRPLFNRKNVDTVRLNVCEYNAVPPGASTPLHRHKGDEIYYIVRGNAKIRIGEKDFQVKPGTAVYIPAGVRHNLQAVGTDMLELFVVTSEVKE